MQAPTAGSAPAWMTFGTNPRNCDKVLVHCGIPDSPSFCARNHFGDASDDVFYLRSCSFGLGRGLFLKIAGLCLLCSSGHQEARFDNRVSCSVLAADLRPMYFSPYSFMIFIVTACDLTAFIACPGARRGPHVQHEHQKVSSNLLVCGSIESRGFFGV